MFLKWTSKVHIDPAINKVRGELDDFMCMLGLLNWIGQVQFLWDKKGDFPSKFSQ